MRPTLAAAAIALSLLFAWQPGAALARGSLLIVGVGDSYSSGQGAPDVKSRARRPADGPGAPRTPARWLGNGIGLQDAAADASTAECYRSNLSWQRLVAERMGARLDADVQFLSFACSGAIIPDVIERAQENTGLGEAGECGELKGQLCEVERAFAGRTIDALLMTIGGNDVGFAPAITTCILVPDCRTASWVTANTMTDIDRAKDLLRERYRKLAAAIEGMNRRSMQRHGRLMVANVFLVEYPSAFRDERGRLCPQPPRARGGLMDPAPDALDLVTSNETRWGEEVIVPALNQMVSEGAAKIRPEAVTLSDPQPTDRAGGRYGFFVSGTSNRFARHGYCAVDDQRWVVRLKDSLDDQGDTNGSVHPNQFGHVAMADVVAPALDVLRAPASVSIDISTSAPEPTAFTPAGLRVVLGAIGGNPAFLQVARRPAEGKNGREGLDLPASREAGALGTPPRFPQVADGHDWTIEQQGTTRAMLLTGLRSPQDIAVRSCTPAACSAWSAPMRAVMLDGFEQIPPVQDARASVAGFLGTHEILRTSWAAAAARPNGFYEIRYRANGATATQLSWTNSASRAQPRGTRTAVDVRRCAAAFATATSHRLVRCGAWSTVEVAARSQAPAGLAPEPVRPVQDPVRPRPSAPTTIVR